MQGFRTYLVISTCLLSFMTMPNIAFAEADSTSSKVSEETPKPIAEWFAAYDQIRRDAEMPLSEKLKYGGAVKKALKTGGKLSPSTQKFAEKMIAKFAAATAAMKALKPVPETKELHDGYIQYFTEMEKNFSDCVHKQEIDASLAESKTAAKRSIETLNNKNKKLDDDLRTKYDVPKHKHS